MEFLTPEEMAECEKRAVSRGVTVEDLMENAGRGIADEVGRRYSPIGGKAVAVVAGTGNNGGDGMVAARLLSEMGAECVVILLGSPDGIRTPEARRNWDRLSNTSVVRLHAEDPGELGLLKDHLIAADIVLDAIFGTGAKGRIRELPAEAVRLINVSKGAIIAVDVPSGLDPMTGEAKEPTVRAHVTITLHRAKVGLKGRAEYTGEVFVVPIGID